MSTTDPDPTAIRNDASRADDRQGNRGTAGNPRSQRGPGASTGTGRPGVEGSPVGSPAVGDTSGWGATLARIPVGDVLRRALHPPIATPAFWAVQASVVALTIIHLILDHTSIVDSPALASVPVAALFVPVIYAALRFGLHGSAATALWASVLWIPDLVTPHHRGDPASDLVSLILVDTVAVIVGQRIEREGMARSLAAEAQARRRATEARYRHLVAATRAPILLFDAAGHVLDANPAAWPVFGSAVLEGTVQSLLGLSAAALASAPSSGRVELTVDGKPAEFRYLSSVSTGGEDAQFQVLLQDVTAERRAWRDVQAYAAALLGAQEEERARLARELHDDPLQSLVHVARRLELVAVHEGVAPDMAERLAAAHAELLDTARRLRDLAQGLRPPALDRLGLAAALQGLVAEEEDGVDTALRLDFTKVGVEQRLVPECELGLYRIAQEALHNALEHASPTRVEVSLSFEESLVLLTVENDGTGFDPTVSSDHAHLGVQGMRERAGLLGGTLVIDSSPDGHTRVTATVPLRPAGTTGETEPCQPADVDVPATGAPTASMPVRSGPPPRGT